MEWKDHLKAMEQMRDSTRPSSSSSSKSRSAAYATGGHVSKRAAPQTRRQQMQNLAAQGRDGDTTANMGKALHFMPGGSASRSRSRSQEKAAHKKKDKDKYKDKVRKFSPDSSRALERLRNSLGENLYTNHFDLISEGDTDYAKNLLKRSIKARTMRSVNKNTYIGVNKHGANDLSNFLERPAIKDKIERGDNVKYYVPNSKKSVIAHAFTGDNNGDIFENAQPDTFDSITLAKKILNKGNSGYGVPNHFESIHPAGGRINYQPPPLNTKIDLTKN